MIVQLVTRHNETCCQRVWKLSEFCFQADSQLLLLELTVSKRKPLKSAIFQANTKLAKWKIDINGCRQVFYLKFIFRWLLKSAISPHFSFNGAVRCKKSRHTIIIEQRLKPQLLQSPDKCTQSPDIILRSYIFIRRGRVEGLIERTAPWNSTLMKKWKKVRCLTCHQPVTWNHILVLLW